ncbi:cytosine/adenosine deaminase-related metal-dependent hydrolase [Marinomonas alcarazii]|uniref:Cytosine/adenosine deaminase-related metal-dependent hydrolase n=1 Tax=Marinomonas alcarazii TaxID=491949 RepID=A0A318V4Q0_9GAMM|nr:amidohydrolase [Marinomonas alcarazii]PYF78939.1 cytosine/adenosine deaminase-related metal-dependent hydrolase [Marinomonas alcarazii]
MKFQYLVGIASVFFLAGCTTMPRGDNADLIIHNGQVLTINTEMEVIDDGVVVVKDDTIIAVGGHELMQQYQAQKVIDAHDGIIMPGMVNAHNHLPMIAFRGLGEEGISNRLFAYFFPLEAQKLSRDLIYNATKLGAIELAQSGVTTYADMYYHMDEMAKATKEVGLRAVLGETVIKFPVVDAKTPYGGVEYGKKFVEEYKGDALITPAYAPHAIYTVSKEKLQEIHALSEQQDVPVLIHVGEFPNEEKRLEGETQAKTPIEYLSEIGVLDQRLVIAHGIHLTPNDQKLLKEADVGIAYNPMANAKGATGIAPAWEMYRADMRIGLGTDGPMSSNQVDLVKTLSYAANMQRLKYSDRTIMIPEQVIEMATLGGAKALHMEDQIGSLEVGKKADIAIFETQSANMMPNYNPYATLVYQANPSNIDTTIVNGKVIMENRVMQTVKLDDIRDNVDAFEADIAEFAKELAKKAIKSKSLMD